MVDQENGRLLSKGQSSAQNENGWCQKQCFAGGYRFAGTEYRESSTHNYELAS